MTTPRGTLLVPLTVPHFVEIRRVDTGHDLTIAVELPRVQGWTFEPSPMLQPRPSPVPGMIAVNLERAKRDLAEARARALAGDLAPLERDVERMSDGAYGCHALTGDR
jgi:hypothetical protein